MLFLISFVVFYLGAYYSVSQFLPTAIPVHHDDYTNYALRFGHLSLAVRPLSTFLIALFATVDPNALIWSTRILAVTYVFLCLCLFDLIEDKKILWVSLMFCCLIFSSPMIGEYARYTGMITHLLSGCLGIMAILLLGRAFESNSVLLAVSASLCIGLSVLAKEDFVVLYLFSFCYFGLKKTSTNKVRLTGFVGLVFAILYMLVVKYFSNTQFLGVLTEQSSYFINLHPVSLAKTVLTYLSGANHPAMIFHGNLVIVLFVMSIVLGLFINRESSSKLFYFIGCALCVIAPYSVLPNHVNAYYEFIWLPFLYFAGYFAINGVFATVPTCVKGHFVFGMALILFQIALAVFVVKNEIPGRKSVANWYDERAQSNTHVFSKILAGSKGNNERDIICIIGADRFSPWYMHDGGYLSSVMKLKNKWLVLLPDSSDELSGFKMGADASHGMVSIDSDLKSANPICSAVINLKAPNDR